MASLSDMAKGQLGAMAGAKRPNPPRPSSNYKRGDDLHSIGSLETWEPTDKSFTKHVLKPGEGESTANDGSVVTINITPLVFVNGARRAQLEERVRSMCVLYDRPCIIVEKEPVKGQEQKVPARQQQNTKYTDGVMAAFGQTHIKLLFTDSQEQTAQLMSELAVQEHRKGQAISTPTELTTPQEQVLRFYLTLPGISYVGALNLLHGFRCVADLVQSTHAQLIARGRISDARATDLRAHLNRKFNLQLLSLRS